MAKEIGIKLKITSQGEEKVISNLGELETELTALQATLKTLDFGTAAFKEAQGNIQRLRSEIDNIDKATEGLGAEKRFRAIGDAINVLTGGFQVLSGVIGLFVDEEESLIEVQQAEKAALDVLNVALGINAINTALVESATLRKAAADKIAAAASYVAAAAQRAFNAVLNANPIALAITAVAALGAAFLALSDDTETATKSIDELKLRTDELNKVRENTNKILDEELKKVSPLIAESELETTSKKRRVEILKEIQKLYPKYLENQKLEKLTIGDIVVANEKLRETILKVAQVRAAENELAEIGSQIFKNNLQIRQNELDLQNRIEQAAGILSPSQLQKFIEAQTNLNNGITKNIQLKNKEAEVRKQAVVQLINETGSIEGLTSAGEKNAKTEKKNTDAILTNIQKRIKALDLLIGKLDESQKAEIKYTTDILAKQKEVIDKQEAFIQERTDKFKTQGEKLVEEIQKYLLSSTPSITDIKKLSEGYSEFFNIISTSIRSGEIDFTKATGWDKFVEFAETKLPGISEKLTNVNEDSRKSFVEYFNNLDERLVALRTKIEGELFGYFDLPPTAELLGKLLDVETKIAEIRANAVKNGLTQRDVEAQSLNVIREAFGIRQQQERIAKDFGEALFNQLEAEKQGNTELAAKYKERAAALDAEGEKLQNVAKAILNGVIRTDEFVKSLISVGVESDKNLAKILKLEEAIKGAISPDQLKGLKEFFKQNAQDYLDIFTDILNNEQGYFEKLGKDGITALFSGIDEGLLNVEGKTRKQLEEIQKFLKLFGDEFAKDFGLGENPFLKALDAISKKLKTLPTESEESFKKTIDSIKAIADQILAAFNDISSRLSNIIASQNSLILEQLQYQQDAAIASVEAALGQSAEGDARIAKEKEAIQKDFAKKRFEAEKKARVQELQFTLANTLAQAAQAVVNALATIPAPFGAIYSGVIAGLTAAQVAVINDQIQFTQNKVFIGRRGGLINGASHDDMSGGVPAMLEGGEFVVNKEAVKRYGDIIGSINNSTGGRPLTIDDSRLVQAIASQNNTKTPIKSYVLYNDIKDTDKLNNKIEQLSRL